MVTVSIFMFNDNRTCKDLDYKIVKKYNYIKKIAEQKSRSLLMQIYVYSKIDY